MNKEFFVYKKMKFEIPYHGETELEAGEFVDSFAAALEWLKLKTPVMIKHKGVNVKAGIIPISELTGSTKAETQLKLDALEKAGVK